PHLWIGVTGADAIWPLDVVEPRLATAEDRQMLEHLQPVKPFDAGETTGAAEPGLAGRGRAREPGPDGPARGRGVVLSPDGGGRGRGRDLGTDGSAWSSVVFIALSVVALIHVALYWRPNIVPPHSAFVRFFSGPPCSSRPRYLLIAFVTLLVAYGTMVFMLLV